MKKYLVLLCTLAVLVTACKKENGNRLPTVNFSQTFLNIYKEASLDVKVRLDRPAGTALSIPIITSGDAVIDRDFSLSSHYAEFAADDTETIITVTDLGLTPGKNITLTLQSGPKWNIGAKSVTVISLDTQQRLIYSFEASEAVVLESYIANVTLTGVEDGNAFVAAEDLTIPLSVTGEGAAHIQAGEILVKAGESKGSATITLSDPNFSGSSAAILKVDGSAARYIPGDKPEILLLIRGLQTPEKLLGKWTFDHIYDQETIELFAMEDEVDVSDFLENTGFELTFSDDGNGGVTLSATRGSDFSAFFLENSPIVLATPKNYAAGGILVGKYSVQESNMYIDDECNAGAQVWTYYSIRANRKFSKTETEEGDCVIAFRLTADNDLEMQFREFDLSRFEGTLWGSSFDAEMFGFASLFKKVL